MKSSYQRGHEILQLESVMWGGSKVQFWIYFVWNEY